MLGGVVATLSYADLSSSEKGQLWQEALKALSQLMLGPVSWLMCVPAHLVWWPEEFVPRNLLWRNGNMPFLVTVFGRPVWVSPFRPNVKLCYCICSAVFVQVSGKCTCPQHISPVMRGCCVQFHCVYSHVGRVWVVFHCFRHEGKILFSCSVDGQVVLWSSSNQPYDIIQVRHTPPTLSPTFKIVWTV
jgi:hypothetical protein